MSSNYFLPISLRITIMGRITSIGWLGCFSVACSGYFSQSKMKKANDKVEMVPHDESHSARPNPILEKCLNDIKSINIPEDLSFPEIDSSSEDESLLNRFKSYVENEDPLYGYRLEYVNPGNPTTDFHEHCDPLLNAIDMGDVDKVKSLLSEGEKSAFFKDSLSIIGTDLRHPFGYPLLMMALDRCKGAKYACNVRLVPGPNPNDDLIAISYGTQRAIAMHLIEHKAIDVNVQDQDGNTPLMLMIAINREDHFYLPIIEGLIARGAYMNVTNKKGKTALSKAIKNISSFKTIYLLLENGAIPSLLDLKTLLESDDFNDQEKKDIIEISKCFFTEKIQNEMATWRCSEDLKQYIKTIPFNPKSLQMLAAKAIKNRLTNPIKNVKQLKELPQKLQRIVIDAS